VDFRSRYFSNRSGVCHQDLRDDFPEPAAQIAGAAATGFPLCASISAERR
jgi:hypothetical protein